MPKGPNWRVIAAIKEFGDNEQPKKRKEKKNLKQKNQSVQKK